MGWLNRLFGRSQETARRDLVASDGTEKAVLPAQSAKRAMEIPSAQFDAAAPQKTLDRADTGPWFIGKTVGEIYQIRSVLGRGGMGIVYGAYDTATQRDIAVKVPLGNDEEGRKRFTHEAETWSGLIRATAVGLEMRCLQESRHWRGAVSNGLWRVGAEEPALTM